MLEYVAIDFETANEQRSSPCAVGVVVIKEGQPNETFYSLIKPKECRFSEFNISVHGITPQDVQDKREFPDIWRDVRPLLQGKIILAHNASFDMSVLRSTMADYRMAPPELVYSCTRLIAKTTWPGLASYRLTMVARLLGIEFQHHLALDDARACAEIARAACQKTDSRNLDQLAERLNLDHGRIFQTGEYQPPTLYWARHPRNASSRIDVGAITPSRENFDAAHPFHGKVIAFTGALACMSRRQAMQAAVDAGAEVANGVTKHTNFLVTGEQDYRKFAEGETKSAKLRKAETLVAKGQEIEILGEEDFLQLLGL